MIRSARLLFCILPLCTTTALSEESRRKSVSIESLTTDVGYLASDELGGRGVGTPGIEMAARYIAEQFEAIGLEPGGDEGSYFQLFDVMGRSGVLEVHDQPIGARLFRDFVCMRTLSGDITFEGDVVFAGYGISNPDRKHDDYANLDVQDKIVMMFRREPQGWEQAGDFTNHAAFATKAELAHEHGAKAVLFVNPPRGDDDELVDRRSMRERYPLPMVHITRKLANLILAAGGFEDTETLHAWIAQGKSVSGPLNELKITGSAGRKPFGTNNVIGVLPGRGDLADEFVIFGAHYDHLGTVKPTRMPEPGHQGGNPHDRIHNGADDNASGTAAVIELARVFASGPAPRRSLVFMGFSAEEVGLNGSRHFVDHPTIPIENAVAMINLDMVGRLEEDDLEVYGTKTGAEFEDLLNKHSEAMDLSLRMTGGGDGPSDHSSFFNSDIPVLFFFTGLHSDYHRPEDDADKLDYPGMVRVIQLVESVSSDIIAADVRPTFKSITGGGIRRDRSGGSPLKVRMGIMPSYADSGKAKGWPIDGVTPGGSADKAGLKKGDRILSISEHSVKDIQDYMQALKDNKPGDKVAVVILRDDKEMTLEVELQGR